MSASQSPRRLRRLLQLFLVALGHACVHTLNVALYLFMMVLALVAGLLVYVLARDDIPLPDFAIREIERRLAQSGIEAEFSRARIDLHGGVVIENLRLEPSRFGEPVLEAGSVALSFDELFLAAGMIELVEARLDDVRLICPAAISPTGAPFPLVEISGLELERSGRSWNVLGVLARTRGLHLTLHGTITPPPTTTPREPPTIGSIVDAFAMHAPKTVQALLHLDAFEEPRAEVSFDVMRSGEITVDLALAATAWRDPRAGEARDLRLDARLQIIDGSLAPFTVQAAIDRFAGPQQIELQQVAARAHWDGKPDLKKPYPSSITISAANLRHPKVTLAAPAAEIITAAYPEVDARVTLELVGEPLEIAIRGDAVSRSGSLEARGRFGSGWLPEASRVLGRDVTYYAAITDAPDFWVRVQFAENARWHAAEFSGTSGPIVARGVSLDRARIRGTATPEAVELDKLEITRGAEWATGVYSDALKTREHRLVLQGQMRPLSIAPWFSGWWTRFWDDFAFGDTAPWFDIDVAGNWTIPGSDVVRGRGLAQDGSMRGIGYTTLDTRFHVQANYYDLYDASVMRPEGRVDGEVQLQYRKGQRDAERTRFSFRSTADLVELARIFGKGGEALLEPYRYSSPPFTTVSGVVINNAGRFDTKLDVGIETSSEFRYNDFPVSALSTNVRIHNTKVEIQRLQAGYADGTLRATGVAEKGVLKVSATLDNASYDDATGIFNEFLDRRAPPPPDEREPAGLGAHRPGGRLSLAVDARGPITTFDAYEGTGTLRITGASLGSVRIFGLLSDLMRTINPRLGSLTFTDAASTFEIRRDRVAFPDLRITGRTAALETEGTYYINSKNLDFKARLYPLGESGGAITQLFDFVLGPVSFLLELRLTGTLRKPSWSLSRMPFAPKPVIDEGTPSTPPPSDGSTSDAESTAEQGATSEQNPEQTAEDSAAGDPAAEPAQSGNNEAPGAESSAP